MKIIESKNLEHDKMPIERVSDYEALDPGVCILEEFERADDKLTLYFKNRSSANIRARNIEGGKEIDSIEYQLSKFVGKSYEEILNTPFYAVE